jgi:phenol 2-monooxygenase
MAEIVDVLICGSGSAGICAATWLAKCGIRCKIIDSRSGPLVTGQADGVQCRTVEIFESFGVAEELLRDSYHVLEVCFWSCAEEDGPIIRTRHAADTPPGLSHQPHVILNQARVHGILTDAMRRFNNQEVEYGYTVTNVETDSIAAVENPESHCVTITTTKDGREHKIKAKYVLVSGHI